MTSHHYDVSVHWTGNRGSGTSGYRDFGRDHDVAADGTPTIAGSADPAFRGDPSRWNPEQLFTATLAQCHMLWYLHLAAQAGVVVSHYTDDAVGTMVTDPDGGGRFVEVLLRPRVTVSSADMLEPALLVHESAHEKCFLANSVSFPIRHDPVVTADGTVGPTVS